MSTLRNAFNDHGRVTENGCKTYATSNDPQVDLFFKIGSARQLDLSADFSNALDANMTEALRVLFWSRDVRGGAGERSTFRKLAGAALARLNQDQAEKFLELVPEYGRWDDLLEISYQSPETRTLGYQVFLAGVLRGNGLAAKWAPRKGGTAAILARMIGVTPRNWRKLVVANTTVVETQMCAKQWNEINFSHVPSLAHTRYTKAFFRNAKDSYIAYKNKLVAKDESVKINTSAVFPYNIVHSIRSGESTSVEVLNEMWNQLPNYVGDANILPMVDVSGSMDTKVSGSVTAMDVAISLGLYLADKNTGRFAGEFMTFSGSPEFVKVTGRTLRDKVSNMSKAHWAMNTNLQAAFDKLLAVAVSAKLPADEMPAAIMIMSDMQFDACGGKSFGKTAFDMIRQTYANAGYTAPAVVFWNINARGDVPVKVHDSGVGLVSGFSPAIMTSILACPEVTPRNVMLSAINSDRYDPIDQILEA
jgi:hypothetical protein